MKIKVGTISLDVSENSDLAQDAVLARQISLELDNLRKGLEVLNARIVEYVSPYMKENDIKTAHISTDEDKIICTIRDRDMVVIRDIGRLRAELAERFDDLVRVKTEYAPERKLIEYAKDNPAIQVCLGTKAMKTGVSYKEG